MEPVSDIDEPAAPMPPDRASCLGCGYPLRGLRGRVCPECGQSFDPGRFDTMRVPGEPDAIVMKVFKPAHWNHRGIRWGLILIVAGSAWFPGPHVKPLLVLLWVWLIVAWPHYARTVNRRAAISKYELPPELLLVDDEHVRSVRRAFLIACVLLVTNLPFLAAFAISRPFLARTAWHWWAVAPANVDPPKGWTIRGVFPIREIDARMSGVTFQMPGGKITFKANARGDGMVATWPTILDDL